MKFVNDKNNIKNFIGWVKLSKDQFGIELNYIYILN